MRHHRSKSLGVTFDVLPSVDEVAAPAPKSDDPLAHHFPHTDSPTPPPSKTPSRASSLVDLDSVRRLANPGALDSSLHRSSSGSWLDRWGVKAKEMCESETHWSMAHSDDEEDSEDEEPLVVRPRTRRQISDESKSTLSSTSTSSIATPVSPRSINVPTVETEDEEDVASIMATHGKPSPLARLLSLTLPDLDEDLTPRAEPPSRSSSWLGLRQSA